MRWVVYLAHMKADGMYTSFRFHNHERDITGDKWDDRFADCFMRRRHHTYIRYIASNCYEAVIEIGKNMQGCGRGLLKISQHFHGVTL
jgi:hypothetical protein